MSILETSYPPVGTEGRLAPEEVLLRLFNPSPYARVGLVTTPWAPIAEALQVKSGEVVVVRDGEGRLLPSQVDEIDPEGPSRAELAFLLAENLGPGSEHYTESTGSVTVRRNKNAAVSKMAPKKLPAAREELTLENRRLNVTFHLGGKPDDWFTGSATSVLLDGLEVLDSWLGGGGRAWLPHDSEKRCLQVDRVRLFRPPWEEDGWQDVELCKIPYRVISESSGPVRSSVTIASEPFKYAYNDPSSGARREVDCRLYRVFNLEKNADYLTEDLYIKVAGANAGKPQHLRFSPRYFAVMDMSFEPEIFRYANVPDWFAVGSTFWPPFPGYGFATDVHASEVAHPHPGYPDPGRAHKTFSWEVLPSRRARCVHLFMAGRQQSFEHRAGHLWYELIYKPLQARLQEA